MRYVRAIRPYFRFAEGTLFEIVKTHGFIGGHETVTIRPAVPMKTPWAGGQTMAAIGIHVKGVHPLYLLAEQAE